MIELILLAAFLFAVVCIPIGIVGVVIIAVVRLIHRRIIKGLTRDNPMR